MASSPEEIKQGRAGLSHQVATPLPDVTPPITLPLVDYKLISVPAEAERRANLLSRVTVDNNGVAHCTDDRSATETLLAAVRISDSKDATLTPLVAGSDQLHLFLPSDRPSRIGFFVSYISLQETAAVLRMGLYPGVPLTTQTVADNRTAEVMYGLGGIKGSETDEQRWAEQIGLYSALNFAPRYSRGMFDKHHRPHPASDRWQVSPLIILPDEILDMLRGYDPKDVKKDEFQIQFFGIKPVPVLLESPDPLRYPFGTRGGGDTLSFGRGMKGFEDLRFTTLGVETEGEPTRGLGIRFGEAVIRTAQTRGTDTDSLRGAFKIIVTPQQ